MSDLVEQCKIELTCDEIENIVARFVENKMEKEGYTLTQSTNQSDGYWPTMLYRGEKK